MSNPRSGQINSSIPVASGGTSTMGAPEISLETATNLTNMMGEVRRQVQQQSDTSTMLMNQIARLQRELSVVQAGSSTVHLNAFPSIFQAATPNPSSSMFSPYHPSRLSSENNLGGVNGDSSFLPTTNPFGNPMNNLSGSSNPTFNFNHMNSSYVPNMDAGYAQVINAQVQELRNAMLNIPGMTMPHYQASPTCFNESRFTPAIASIVIPKKFSAPVMQQFDGTTDPVEHIALYQEKMDVAHLPLEFKEACLCRGFGSTLSGAALKWLINQPLNSIGSYSQLVNMFTNQFSCNRVYERRTSDLYRVVQQPDELLKDYLIRFNREAVTISNLDMTTAVEALRIGLKKDSPYYDDLVMAPCRNLEEARTRATRFIRLEEDKLMRLERDNLMQDYCSTDWNGGMLDDDHGWYQDS